MFVFIAFSNLNSSYFINFMISPVKINQKNWRKTRSLSATKKPRPYRFNFGGGGHRLFLPLPLSPSPLLLFSVWCIHFRSGLASGFEIQAFKLSVLELPAGVRWACFRPDSTFSSQIWWMVAGVEVIMGVGVRVFPFFKGFISVLFSPAVFITTALTDLLIISLTTWLKRQVPS